ncbi:hypothetical protein B0H10DRAFT_2094268 [Mycena sp. CBHHK59/15]|nr:hypothetical protein B0H10DRAFT_2094268 [Mycena sp. CBHHK59/15]
MCSQPTRRLLLKLRTLLLAMPPPSRTTTHTSWVWSAEVAGGRASVGTRAFRMTFATPAGKIPTVANITINADDDFRFYGNGAEVGSAADWTLRERFCGV